MSECVFCKIVSGAIPASMVYEDDLILAFMDQGQVNPGHVIVAVKPHLLQANGAAGWQTVFHFHIHVLPRHPGDGVTVTWPARRPPMEELERLGMQVRAALAG